MVKKRRRGRPFEDPLRGRKQWVSITYKVTKQWHDEYYQIFLEYWSNKLGVDLDNVPKTDLYKHMLESFVQKNVDRNALALARKAIEIANKMPPESIPVGYSDESGEESLPTLTEQQKAEVDKILSQDDNAPEMHEGTIPEIVLENEENGENEEADAKN